MSVEQQEQPVEIERLAQVGDAALVKNLGKAFAVGGGNEDGKDSGIKLFKLTDEVQAVHAGQIEIHQGDVGVGTGTQRPQGFFPRTRGGGGVAACRHESRQRPPGDAFIFDDQDIHPGRFEVCVRWNDRQQHITVKRNWNALRP